MPSSTKPASTPVDRFRRLVRTHYGILHDTGSDFIPVMLYDWRSLPTQYRRRIIELKDRYDAIWQATLEELHRQGRLAAEPKLARLMILGAINFSATWYQLEGRAARTASTSTLSPPRPWRWCCSRARKRSAPSSTVRIDREELSGR